MRKIQTSCAENTSHKHNHCGQTYRRARKANNDKSGDGRAVTKLHFKQTAQRVAGSASEQVQGGMGI